MRFKAICLIVCSFFVITRIANAESIEICGELKQGELILLKNVPAIRVEVANNRDRKSYKADKNGTVMLALHRDAPEKILFDAVPLDDYVTHYEVDVAPGIWDIQKIDGVEQSKVTPVSAEDLAEIYKEQSEISRVLRLSSNYEYWKEGFVLPVKGRISGNFGNQRIFNGTPKNPHSGTDIAAPEGVKVKASGSGKVALVGQNYFYTGNVVIIDHGYGLHTIYAHLKEAKVKEGDFVAKGEVIGLVGKTGRATGPHLHWGASLKEVRFRPHSLLNMKAKQCRKISGKWMGEEAENE